MFMEMLPKAEAALARSPRRRPQRGRSTVATERERRRQREELL